MMIFFSRKHLSFLSILFTAFFISSCSTDSGPVTGWQQAGLQGVTINRLNLQDGKLYAGSSEGIYSKEMGDKEAGWRSLGLDKQVYDFVVWDDQTLLAGTSITDDDTVSIYKTTNGGSSWIPYQQNFGREDQNNILFVVEQHPRDEDILYARGDFNVAKSENSGESWTNIYGSWDGYGEGQFLTIYLSNPDIIWGGGATATFAPHLFKSNDGGVKWTYMDQFYNEADATCHDALIHPTDSKQVIVGLGGVVSQANIIRRSQDGGLSWLTVFSGMYTRTLAQSPNSPETVYASGRNANGTVFFARSTDFGQTWQTNEFPDSPADVTVHDMVATTKEGQEVLYLGTNKGVFSYTFEE